jgi:phage N-6-adenine-methyltransferase
MAKLIAGASKFDSNNNEWETTQSLFDILNSEFKFTIDIAASQSNAKLPIFFTRDDNALINEWKGICWCNPPFGDKGTNALKFFVKKGHDEYCKNNNTIVMLVPTRTNTNWWRDYCSKAKEIRFITGRPNFKGCTHGLMQPLAIIVFAPHIGETIIKYQNWRI